MPRRVGESNYETVTGKRKRVGGTRKRRKRIGQARRSRQALNGLNRDKDI